MTKTDLMSLLPSCNDSLSTGPALHSRVSVNSSEHCQDKSCTSHHYDRRRKHAPTIFSTRLINSQYHYYCLSVLLLLSFTLNIVDNDIRNTSLLPLFANAWVVSPRVTTSRAILALRSTSLSTETDSPTSSSVAKPSFLPPTSGNSNIVLEKDADGTYHLDSAEQHAALLQQNADKILVLKVYAPWCRACKGLEPKFLQLVHDPKYNTVDTDTQGQVDLPIVWAQLSIQHNKEFVKSLGIVALPTIQFYAGKQILDTFSCGPSKVALLKRKLAQFINESVDLQTYKLKESVLQNVNNINNNQDGATATTTMSLPMTANETMMDAATTRMSSSTTVNGAAAKNATESVASAETLERRKSTTSSDQSTSFDRRPTDKDIPVMDANERQKVRENIVYFTKMDPAEADNVLDKAKLLSFNAGAVIVREGKPGRTFYILKKGEVEVCQKQQQQYMADPLITMPQSYLGTVMNRLGEGDYFGERALITGEPRAASIRASAPVVELWALDQDDFPASCVLSGRTKVTDLDINLENINDKYGVEFADFYANQVSKQVQEATNASQKRGSVNRPGTIRGVDTDEDIIITESDTDEVEQADLVVATDEVLQLEHDAVLSLLARFKLIRHVSRCFEYMTQTRARWGDVGIRKRRNMLVNRLTQAQRDEFVETFRLVDTSGDGFISLLELKRVMESIGEHKSDEELMEMIKKGRNDEIDGSTQISFADFMGIMAEAEFYYLFRDIFSTLDTNKSGFVKARELNRVLCGVRNLIGDGQQRNSIVDVDDEDMLIDYEEFSKTLLGTTLI